MYSKVMGIESNFQIAKLSARFMAGLNKDEALVKFDADLRGHTLWYQNYGYLLCPN